MKINGQGVKPPPPTRSNQGVCAVVKAGHVGAVWARQTESSKAGATVHACLNIGLCGRVLKVSLSIHCGEMLRFVYLALFPHPFMLW